MEGLHNKTDRIFHLMTSIEARLEAIEAGILVPFPQPEFSSTSIACSVSSSQFAMESLLQHSQPETSTLTDTQQTPPTPTHRPRTLPSISPIVSSLPDETAVKLKKSRMKSTTRKKFTRKCLEEFFTQDELSASNLSGTSDKQKLDEYKIGLIFSKYIIKSTS